jgi:hypothetical protein
MPREKEPGLAIEEAKARLRLEETEEAARACRDCAEERRKSGDPTAYCALHLRKIYGV